MFDPVIAIVASPRDWPRRLYRYVTEHGGAQVRGTVLDRQEALAQSSDVLLVDDITSFLDEPLVHALHQRGRRVLGVHESAWGRGILSILGVDATIGWDAPADEFLTAAASLSAGLIEMSARAMGASRPEHPPAARAARLLGRVLDPVLVALPGLGEKTVRTWRCPAQRLLPCDGMSHNDHRTAQGGRDGGWD